jgi:phage terminase small subunit
MAGKLTPKQARFVDEYLVDLNGTQAAIRAGYSARGADVQAVRLLGNARISAAIASRQTKRTARTEVTQDRVISELALIAFSDMRDFAQWGNEAMLTEEQINVLVSGHIEIPSDKRVRSLDKEAQRFLESNGCPVEWRTVDLRNSDKLGEVSRAVMSVAEGQHGVSIKLYDKMKALELLGKHLGLADRHELTGKDGKPLEVRTGLTDETADFLRKRVLGLKD